MTHDDPDFGDDEPSMESAFVQELMEIKGRADDLGRMLSHVRYEHGQKKIKVKSVLRAVAEIDVRLGELISDLQAHFDLCPECGSDAHEAQLAHYQHDIDIDYIKRFVATKSYTDFVWQHGVQEAGPVDALDDPLEGFEAVKLAFPTNTFHRPEGDAHLAKLLPLIKKAERIIEVTSHRLPPEAPEIIGHGWAFLFKNPVDAAKMTAKIAELSKQSKH